jgi:CRISPR-associated protein (TIGR03986 family)
MSTIRAPFNFVPLSSKVCFPEWANQISQDIPFSDGMSGTIELKITAESPIFVRNGHTKKDAENKNETYKSFSKTEDGRYFIPATSIKGAVRNVLEIMSFGKMSHISNDRYSIRDLQLKKYLSYFQNADVHCGWMTKKEDVIIITDNGIPRRISHKTLDDKFQTNFCDIFSEDNQKFLKQDSNRSALIKYEMAKGKEFTYRFKELPLNSNNSVDKRIKVKFSDNDKDKQGTIVFTGQPSCRKEAVKNADGTIKYNASGKFYEFVFFDDIEQKFQLNSEEDGGIYKDFCFVYKDSDEWKFWKKIMGKGEKVPVFFSLKDGNLIHFGLSYLYKLPYIQRIKDYLYDEHTQNDKDLCECIFGYTDKQSLRGRVQFSNAFCTEGQPITDAISPYMGGPKPTYYPIYLKQSGKDGYMVDANGKGVSFSTMLDKDAKLRGWKRYPVQKEWQTKFDIPSGQENNTNPFYPMNVGSVFICNVHFYNLKKIELGALFNSLQLHDGYFHSIGFAKAYGYGKIKMEITKVSGYDMADIDTLKKEFVKYMSDRIPDYEKSPQIKELNAMMHEQNLTIPLEYMNLKEFVDCKKQHFKEDRHQTFGEYLQNYSALIKKEISSPKSGTLMTEATVSCFDRGIKQARLIEGKNKQSLQLDIDYKIKLKLGDKIQVKKIMNGGNVIRLVFVKKI